MRSLAPTATVRNKLLLAELQRRGLDLASATSAQIRDALYRLAQTATDPKLQLAARTVADRPDALRKWVTRHAAELRSAPVNTSGPETRCIAVPAGTFTPTSYADALANAQGLAHATGRAWQVLSLTAECQP